MRVGQGGAFGGRFVLVEMLLKEGDLREVDARHAMEGGGDLGDQEQFLDADGLVLGDEFGAQHFVAAAVLNAEDFVPGGQAMGDGVAAGALFPLRGARTGGFLGVAAIGFELFRRLGLPGHVCFLPTRSFALPGIRKGGLIFM